MTDSAEHRVACTVNDGIADVRLDRPEKLNALDGAMFDALITTARQLREDHRVRAVVLSGNGRGFCAGLDFAAFQDMGGGDGEPVRLEGAIRRAQPRRRASRRRTGGPSCRFR